MEFTSQDKERIQHQFNAFCMKVLKHAARNIYRERKYRAQHEVSLSELSEPQLAQLFQMDDYCSAQFVLIVRKSTEKISRQIALKFLLNLCMGIYPTLLENGKQG